MSSGVGRADSRRAARVARVAILAIAGRWPPGQAVHLCAANRLFNRQSDVLSKNAATAFALTTSFGTFTATCTSSTLQAKVTANPSSRGKATLSLIGATFRRCKINGAPDGVSLTSVKALNLPYGVTVSSAKGFPVAIAGRSSAKPLAFQAKINASSVGLGNLTCVVTAPTVKAHASNAGNKISAAKQKFTLDTGKSSSQCSSLGVSSATYSATYGPIRDTSVRHSPKVFFN
jgi:hypothetical protein